MNRNEFDINLPEEGSRQSWAVYAKIVLLPVLVYGFFVFAYFYSFGLKISFVALILMGVILLAALLFAKHSAEFGCFVFERQKNEFKKDLKEYILKSLLAVGKEKKSNGSFDEFVKEYSKFSRNENYASIAANLFAIMGILGTFICLAINLPDFASIKASDFELKISELLIAVATSFYVSIYGILLTLWWMFFERFGMSRFEKLIKRQKLATLGFFWTKEEIEQKYMQESINSFSKISSIFGYVSNQEFFVELDKVIDRKFENFTNMLKTEEQTVKISSEHIKQTMATLQKTQKEQKDIVRVHTDILNALYSFNQNLKELQISFAENYARLHTISDERLVQLEKTVNGFSSGIDKFGNNLKTFNLELMNRQNESITGFKDAMLEGMQAFRKVFDDENISTDESLNTLDKIKEDIKSIDNEARDALLNLQNINFDAKSDEAQRQNLENSENSAEKDDEIKQ